MKKKCYKCKVNRPNLKRPRNGDLVCKACFFGVFEDEIHETIVETQLFEGLKRIGIGISGGKDSVVLAYVLNKLNIEHEYGLDLQLICIDEGLQGYRDESLKSVENSAQSLSLPLLVLPFSDLFEGWDMDKIVRSVGGTNNCSFCGIFRRKALDVGGRQLKCDALVTGHNADDMAETVLMNVMRGDTNRLKKCLDIRTKALEGGNAVRVKPFKYVYEKEIVLYAHFKKLDYFSTECKYYTNSFRGTARELVKDLERIRTESLFDIIKGGEKMAFDAGKIRKQVLQKCQKCGYTSSQKLCRSCVFLNSLNQGDGLVGIYETSDRKLSDTRRKKILEKSKRTKRE